MTFNDIISFCNPVAISGPVPEFVGHVVQDSRKVKPGDVFVAVRGTQVDGHEYIEKAIESGARIIIGETKVSVPEGITLVVVANTRKILSQLALAEYKNPQYDLTIIGVTGTNGKTTVSTLIYQVLTTLGYKAALLGTISKQIGNKLEPSKLTTADAIELASDLNQAVLAGAEYLVMEVSSHALDQDRVAAIPFKVAVFTNLTHDHLDYHKTFEAYANAKKKLFDSLAPDSFAIINSDDPKAKYMVSDCQAEVWECGIINPNATTKIIANSTEGLILDIDETIVQSPLAGKFNALNITEAYLSCLALGCSKSNVASALSSAYGAPGRMEKITIDDKKDLPNIFVDYAHTPDALKNVSETLHHLKKKGQKLNILFGCGGNRDQAKRPKMAEIAEMFGDMIAVTSDNPRFEDPEKIIDDIFTGFKHPDLPVRNSNRKEAIFNIIQMAGPDDIVLIAGKGHEDYQEIKGVRHHLDDREIVREALLSRLKKSQTREVN